MQKIEDGVHRIPTPSTTDGMPSPSAAIAAVGVIITAGTAAPAATSRGVVPRSCAAGAGPLTKARQRRATHAARATQAVISLEERAMMERVAAGCTGYFLDLELSLARTEASREQADLTSIQRT